MSYDPPKFQHTITLPLNRNEAACVMDDPDQQLASLGTEFIARYPSQHELQLLIGQSIGIDPARVVVTAGGDEAIDRIMRTALAGDRKSIVTHVPSFEMVEIYAANYGGKLDAVPWLSGDFPLDALTAKIDSTTALVVVTSPNNPTGSVLSVDQILAIASSAKLAGCQLLVDFAYVEFADVNPTLDLISQDHVMLVRTFSKAWGLAGLRVGYLLAPSAAAANLIRQAAGPFPVSAVSLEIARRCLAGYQGQLQTNLALVKTMRQLLAHLLERCGAQPLPSQGNFVLAKFVDAEKIWQELAADGVGVRKFPGAPSLINHLRITCPVSATEYLQLAQSLCRIHGLDFEVQKNALSQTLVTIANGNAPLPLDAPTVSVPATKLNRQTKETSIELELNLYGTGKSAIETGIGFLDHMLTALTFHSRMDLKLKCVGDLQVDDHHTAEDCALALGSAIDVALGNRSGIQRFGCAFAPLDEALARTVIDLSGRPWPEIHLHLERECVGQWACENIVHFFRSLAMTLRCSLHVDVLRGENDHHRAEAAFKSLAMALRQSLTKTSGAIPSTKGVL